MDLESAISQAEVQFLGGTKSLSQWAGNPGDVMKCLFNLIQLENAFLLQDWRWGRGGEKVPLQSGLCEFLSKTIQGSFTQIRD